MGDQHDGTERELIALLGGLPELVGEIVGERDGGFVGRNVDAIDLGEAPIAASPETKKSPRRRGSGADGGGMSTKKRSSACAFSGGARK